MLFKYCQYVLYLIEKVYSSSHIKHYQWDKRKYCQNQMPDFGGSPSLPLNKNFLSDNSNVEDLTDFCRQVLQFSPPTFKLKI